MDRQAFSIDGQTEGGIKLLQYVYGFADVRLCQVASVEKGERITKAECTGTKYPVIGGSLNPLGFLDLHNFENGLVVINKGNAGDVGFVRGKFFAGEGLFVIKCSQMIVPEFLFHLLKSRESEIKARTYGAIPGLKKNVLENIVIRIPPIEKQVQIVNRLGEFEAELVRFKSSSRRRSSLP